jgi:hypothetical protein
LWLLLVLVKDMGRGMASARFFKMRIKLIKQHGLLLPGAIIDTQSGVAQLLIARGVAVSIEAPDPEPVAVWIADPDQDGIAEAGPTGEKKAFTRPPVVKTKAVKAKQPKRK